MPKLIINVLMWLKTTRTLKKKKKAFKKSQFIKFHPNFGNPTTAY